MSRATKTNENQLLSKLPQKPTSSGFYYELEGESPSPIPTRTSKPQSSVKETAPDSECQEQLVLSAVKQGVAIKVSELFQEKRSSSHSGLLNIVRMCRSSPMVSSMSMLNNQHKNYGSSQKTINRIKTMEEMPNLATSSSKDGRRFRSLISLKPDSIEPKEVLERFYTMTEIEDQVYVVALIYLQSALDMEPDLEFKHLHKLLAGWLSAAGPQVSD